MTAARTARRKDTRRARRSSAGDDRARLAAPHPWLIATTRQRRDTRSARPAVLQHRAAREHGPILFPPTMLAATKSP
jgi:hypothetical protein